MDEDHHALGTHECLGPDTGECLQDPGKEGWQLHGLGLESLHRALWARLQLSIFPLSPPLSSQTKVPNQKLRIAKENVSLGKETALAEADQMSRARGLLCVYQGLSLSHRAKAS